MITPDHRLRRRLAIALVLVAVVAGCGKGGGIPARENLDTFVGRVPDSSVYIALITDGDRMAGYLTDGESLAPISIWLASARFNGSSATIATREGEVLGEVTFRGDTADGKIVVESETREFEVSRATGHAGLFSAAEKSGTDSFQAGWIALPDGSVRGAYDTFIDGVFASRRAPALQTLVNIPGFGPELPVAPNNSYLDTLKSAPD